MAPISAVASVIVAMLDSSDELRTILSSVAIVIIVMVVVMPSSMAVQINGMTARAGVATSLLVEAKTSMSHAVSKASTFENVGLVLLSIAFCVPSSVYILLLVGVVSTTVGVRFDNATAMRTMTSTVIRTSTVNMATSVTISVAPVV